MPFVVGPMWPIGSSNKSMTTRDATPTGSACCRMRRTVMGHSQMMPTVQSCRHWPITSQTPYHETETHNRLVSLTASRVFLSAPHKRTSVNSKPRLTHVPQQINAKLITLRISARSQLYWSQDHSDRVSLECSCCDSWLVCPADTTLQLRHNLHSSSVRKYCARLY